MKERGWHALGGNKCYIFTNPGNVCTNGFLTGLFNFTKGKRIEIVNTKITASKR